MLGIARSTLYYDRQQPNKDWALKCGIENILEIHHDYGYRRVARTLKISEGRAQRVMRLFGIKAYRRRGRKVRRKVKRTEVVYPNLLRSIAPSYPGHVWVSDFTYLPFQGRFLYLATVMDLFTREVVGWSVLKNHSAPLVLQALFVGLLHHSRPVIFHSDNGKEYESAVMVEALGTVGTQISRITPGCPWENGYQESFYSQFKVALGDTNRFNTLGELVYEIYHQLHRYNRTRIHSALLMSPMQFKHRFTQQKFAESLSEKIKS